MHTTMWSASKKFRKTVRHMRCTEGCVCLDIYEHSLTHLVGKIHNPASEAGSLLFYCLK